MYLYFLYNLLVLFIFINTLFHPMPKSWSLIVKTKQKTKKQSLADHTLIYLLYSNKERSWLFFLFSSKTTKKGVFLLWSHQVTNSIKIPFEIVVSRILDKSQNFFVESFKLRDLVNSFEKVFSLWNLPVFPTNCIFLVSSLCLHLLFIFSLSLFAPWQALFQVRSYILLAILTMLWLEDQWF